MADILTITSADLLLFGVCHEQTERFNYFYDGELEIHAGACLNAQEDGLDVAFFMDLIMDHIIASNNEALKHHSTVVDMHESYIDGLNGVQGFKWRDRFVETYAERFCEFLNLYLPIIRGIAERDE